MTSINTNLAATSALRTLQATNSALDATQSRISTGLKIGEAKDNAAYWSISTSLKSDNQAMATVTDALNLGAATVDTAYQGMNSTLDVLNQIKSKLTAASQDGVDKLAVQAEIEELQKQLTSIANSSVFSGENWLSMSSSDPTTKSIVSSFTRSADGSVSLDSVSIDLTSSVLVVSGSTSEGILSKNRVASGDGYTTTATGSTIALTTPVTKAQFDDDSLRFTVTTATKGTQTVTINAATFDNAGLSSIGDNTALTRLLNQALADAKVTGVTASVDGTSVKYTSDANFTIGLVTQNTGVDTTDDLTAARQGNLGLGYTAISTAASVSASLVNESIFDIDVGTASKSKIKAYLEILNTATNEVTAAAANLGAVASRLDLQKTFVTKLMDTIEKGISGLIDADMNEESTKLQALQVKQQLGVQALSIANQSAQNVLSLFRG